MTETKGSYNAGQGAEDRRLAERLGELWREIDLMRAALPNDEAHAAAFTDLGEPTGRPVRA